MFHIFRLISASMTTSDLPIQYVIFSWRGIFITLEVGILVKLDSFLAWLGGKSKTGFSLTLASQAMSESRIFE